MPRPSNRHEERRPSARRRWRDYRTESGNRPVRDFLLELHSEDRTEVLAAMDEVAEIGMRAARHLHGDIYEVRAERQRRIFRVLFAQEGRRGQVLLAVVGFVKKTQRTPEDVIDLAIERLRDWRGRGKRHSV